MDRAKAEEERADALQQGLDRLRDRYGVPQGSPLPHEAWGAARAVDQASRLIPAVGYTTAAAGYGT